VSRLVTMKNLIANIVALIFISDIAKAEIKHEFISQAENSAKIEIFWSKPTNKGKYPLLILVHPHQSWPDKVGGKVFINNNFIKKWSDKGYVVAALSQPGYGESDGSSDFCGERSQQAVIETINFFKKKPFVMSDKVFLYGGSRGAVVSSMVATKQSGLAGVILKSGVYDFIKAYKSYSWFNSIKLSMLWEIGWPSEEKLKSRSAFYFADQIKIPLLVIHGTEDDRADIESAKEFVSKINAAGGQAEFLSVKSEHIIPTTVIEPYMEDFFKKVLK